MLKETLLRKKVISIVTEGLKKLGQKDYGRCISVIALTKFSQN